MKKSCESVGRVMCVDVDWGWGGVDGDYWWHWEFDADDKENGARPGNGLGPKEDFADLE